MMAVTASFGALRAATSFWCLVLRSGLKRIATRAAKYRASRRPPWTKAFLVHWPGWRAMGTYPLRFTLFGRKFTGISQQIAAGGARQHYFVIDRAEQISDGARHVTGAAVILHACFAERDEQGRCILASDARSSALAIGDVAGRRCSFRLLIAGAAGDCGCCNGVDGGFAIERHSLKALRNLRACGDRQERARLRHCIGNLRRLRLGIQRPTTGRRRCCGGGGLTCRDPGYDIERFELVAGAVE